MRRSWTIRDGLTLLVAVVLSAFVAWLIGANYTAACRLRDALTEQAEHETVRRAEELASFLDDQQETLAAAAASAEVIAYHENKALGMSPEYGLRQSQLIIGERLEALRLRRLVGTAPVFRRLALYDRSDALLAESPSGPAPSADPPAATDGLTADRRALQLSAQVEHRGAPAGRLVALIDCAVLRGLCGAGSDGGSATVLVPAEAPSRPVGEVPGRALPTALPATLGTSGRPQAVQDGDHQHLIITAPVPGSPFAVVSLRSSARYLGSEPWHSLAIALILSALLLGGSVALVVHQVRSRALGRLVTEMRDQSVRNRETLDREVQARRAAEADRSRLGHAVEQAAESIFITDLAGIIQYANPAFTAVTGWPREEAVGQTPRILRSGVHDEAFYAAMKRELSAGRPWTGRLVNRRRDGSLLHVDATISPVRDESGTVVGFVAAQHDIGALVQMEGRLHQAQKLESIGQLAAGIAHEINTPVQFIGDNLRFLGDGFRSQAAAIAALRAAVDGGDRAAAAAAMAEADLDYLLAEIPTAIAQSREGVDRVAQIVRAMKDFSHPDGAEPVPCDLNRAIESTLTVSRNEWKQLADIDQHLDPALPQVPLLLGDFNQAVLNLVVNAAHAIGSRPGGGRGRIGITTRRDDDHVEVRVADDGCGMPAEVQRRIFEPFFTTKPVGKGTGQGLAMARQLVVQRLHGTITFASAEGVGTTFVIRLPLGPVPAQGGSERNGDAGKPARS